ncbi:MAG: electron transfer flavoprotein subunit alpha/FixB family protein [Bacillota bacterium]
MEGYQGVWIFGEQKNGVVQAVSYELLARGRQLADLRRVQLTAVILGKTVSEGVQELVERGADRVIIVENEGLKHFLPEPYTSAMAYLVEKYRPEIIIAGATSTGRTLMPLLAVKCRAGLTADCTQLGIEEGTGNLLQSRPAIGGNIMATIKSPRHRPQMATVRPRSMKPALRDKTRKGEIIRELAPAHCMASRIKRIGFQESAGESSNLQEADVIVAGGRGMKKAENFKLIYDLAKVLDGAVGATRDAVDRGWAAYPQQIGLSGKTVSPKVYICAGISGSIQHLAGIKTAEHIIAINTNPEAQIFKVANYGIVGDLFEILPVLTDKIAIRKNING